ncbi:MAG: mechanosensitive ion channel [Dehalococcoidales bacterium]|nr:mechanosensitive ion channel [Dehalococcoidales bacterium]
MWQWFTVNGLGILIWSIAVLVALVIIMHRIENRIEKTAAGKESGKRYRRRLLAVRVLIWTCLTFIGLAAAAVVTSRQGIEGMVTQEAVEVWFLEHGVYVLAVASIAYLFYRLARAFIPRVADRWVKGVGKGRHAREERIKRSHTLGNFLTGSATAVIVLVAVLMILSKVGINITPLLAAAGVVGIAIGFGAQSLIRDMLRGSLILMQNQYNKGDVVRIAGITGLVEDVNIMRTVMRDLDGIVHSIPNGEISTASNYTKEWSRVNIDIPVAYGEDLDHVTEVINRVGAELAEDDTFGPMITAAPKVLRVNKFGDSGIDLKVLGETKPLMQWEVTGELRKRVKKAFDREGIEIPWPHVKLYFGNSPMGERLPCPSCSQLNLPGSRFCAHCGASLTPK